MRKIPIYNHPAAGWAALASSALKLKQYGALTRGSVSVFQGNQPEGGFDCPGCAWPDHKSRKTIDMCENGIKVVASETMATKADAAFFAQHSVSELQGWNGYQLERAGRLSEPLYYDAEQDRYLPIAWESAYQIITEQLQRLDSPDEAMFYTSGRITNEPAFMFQLLVRSFGTNNLPDCSNMCHEPTSVMLSKQLGIGKATVILEDFEQARLIILFGQNPATNHPRMLEMLAHAQMQGCRIISVNPMREQGLFKFRNPQKPSHMVAGQSDKMVDEVVQIRIGGDVALMAGIAKCLVEQDAINREFIANHTKHVEALIEWLHQQNWSDIEQACGIARAKITALAKEVAESPRTICTWGMGITQHVQGEDNVAMITNLLLLMGMIGIDGAGACPVRGHSNVQGDRTMGVHERPKPELLDSLERVFGQPMPREAGLDVVEGAKALINGKIKAFISLGGNYSVAAPDSDAIQQALIRTPLTVFVATKLNESMLYPGKHSLILPSLSRTEQLITANGTQVATIEDSMCQVVPTQGRLSPISDKVKSDAQIIADIASHLFDADSKVSQNIPWQAMAADFSLTRDYIAQAIDGFEHFNQRLAESPRGFHLYHSARARQWQTESGKAEFVVPQYPITYALMQTDHALPVENAKAGAGAAVQDRASSRPTLWQLTTVRSHDQFNTTIFGFEDRYRNTNRRDVLFMHPDEMLRMGWQAGDSIMVSRQDSSNQRRTLGPLILTEMDIAANAVAAYYPESNTLIDLDSHAPTSKTPAYKSIPVTLERVTTASLAASVLTKG